MVSPQFLIIASALIKLGLCGKSMSCIAWSGMPSLSFLRDSTEILYGSTDLGIGLGTSELFHIRVKVPDVPGESARRPQYTIWRPVSLKNCAIAVIAIDNSPYEIVLCHLPLRFLCGPCRHVFCKFFVRECSSFRPLPVRL